MFSGSLKIALGAGGALSLLSAMIAVNSALSWRPVAVDFPIAILRGPTPIQWKNNRLWLMTRDVGTASLPNVSATGGVWRTVRNWNRLPLPIQYAGPYDYSVAAVGNTEGEIAHSRYSSPQIEIWHGKKLLHVVSEQPHRSRGWAMPLSLPALLELSPDGTKLVADSSFYGLADPDEIKGEFCPLGLVLFDVGSGKRIVRQSAFEGGFTDFAWSPDSREVAAITADGWVFVLNAGNGKVRLKFRAHQLFGAQIAWSPDGKTLVTATNPRLGDSPTHFRFYLKSGGDFAIGDEPATVRIGKAPSQLLLIRRTNGDITWNGQTEQLLKRFDALTGKQQGAPVPLETGAADLAFSPDGSSLAVGEHNFALILNATDWTTERRLTVPSTQQNQKPSVTAAPVCVTWSPEGTTLATSTWRGLTLWRMR